MFCGTHMRAISQVLIDLNSLSWLWPSDAIWWQESESALAQVMAWFRQFSFNKMHLRISLVKWQPFLWLASTCEVFCTKIYFYLTRETASIFPAQCTIYSTDCLRSQEKENPKSIISMRREVPDLTIGTSKLPPSCSVIDMIWIT